MIWHKSFVEEQIHVTTVCQSSDDDLLYVKIILEQNSMLYSRHPHKITFLVGASKTKICSLSLTIFWTCFEMTLFYTFCRIFEQKCEKRL